MSHANRGLLVVYRRKPEGDCIMSSKVVLMCWRWRRLALPIVELNTETNARKEI